MKKFKKILIPVVAIALLLSICTLTGCGMFNKRGIDAKKEQKAHDAFIEALGGVSDTYIGSASEYVYYSTDEAADAYIHDQLGHNNFSIVDTQSAGTLTDSQIASFNLSEEDSEGIISIEEFDVMISDNYASLRNNSGIALLGTLDSSKTVKVYIIKYNNGFKYYSPCPVTGETVTRDYYDSVFNSDKYKNCTYTSDNTVEEKISLFGFINITITVNVAQTIRYADNAIYIEQKTDVSPAMFESLLEDSIDKELYAYVTEDEYGSLDCYISRDGETWNPGSLSTIGFRNLEELTPFYDEYLDYTYFTKTDYGFELANENAKQYIDESFEDIDLSDYTDFNIDMFAKYYVCDGTLFGMRSELYADFSMSAEIEDEDGEELNMELELYAVSEIKITDCGTTVVERPF